MTVKEYIDGGANRRRDKVMTVKEIKKELDTILDRTMLALSKGIDRSEILNALAVDVISVRHENTPTETKKILEENLHQGES